MYPPLKITTDNSLLKSLIKVDDLILFLVKNNIKAAAIVDDNLFGVLDFYFKCQKNNIKPLIGLSVIMEDTNVYLYAKNYEGYKALLKINTIIEKGTLDISIIKEFKDNLLIILPTPSHHLYSNLEFMQDDLYLGISMDGEYNKALKITNNVIFVNDIRAIYQQDLIYLTYLDKLALREEKKYLDNYYREIKEQYYAAINDFVKKVNIVIPLNQNYTPIFSNKYDSLTFLKALAHKGLIKRKKGNVPIQYQKRLNYELSVIEKMHFADYFLIVYDYVLYAKKHNILVGCRGSAAASIVSYAIGITDIDPLQYNLLFERFLNPERITMPDIDIDFDALKREEVISYVKNKYGVDNVARGLTFTTLKAKLVLRECAKILNIPDNIFNKFIKNIDSNLTLKENLNNGIVRQYLKNYNELATLYKVAQKLEFLKRNVSTHAAGIIISKEKLDNIIPICESNGELLTGVTMDYLETLGLLKMDFLGLKNLSFIAAVIQNIPNCNLNAISLEDPRVFALFNNLDVDGIFQFETPLMRKFLTTYKINCFSDLIAAVALVRPGAKEHINLYLERKNKKAKITYISPDLEPILKETYGIILYQEQIMLILTKVASYSLAEADIIRRAIAKKKDIDLKKEKEKFIQRALKNNYSKEVALAIYQDIEKFASYGFNKSHSVAYAVLAYQMAYLKTYYKAYFTLEMLKTASKEKIKEIIISLKSKNFKIVKPTVNGVKNYTILDNVLYLPIKQINNITSELALKIMRVREEKFWDYFDFIYKCQDFLNKELVIKLIKAEALSCFNLNENTLINNYDMVLNYCLMNDQSIDKPSLKLYPDLSIEEKRANEIASYDMFLSNHPSSRYCNVLKITDMVNMQFKKVKMVVLITKITNIKTKNNEDMAFLEASDETGETSFTVFPESYKYLENIKVNDLVMVYGSVTKRFDKLQIIVNNMKKVVNDFER